MDIKKTGVDGITSNQQTPIDQTNKPKDTEFQREVDYRNTPNPAETLGRSMMVRLQIPQHAQSLQETGIDAIKEVFNEMEEDKKGDLTPEILIEHLKKNKINNFLGAASLLRAYNSVNGFVPEVEKLDNYFNIKDDEFDDVVQFVNKLPLVFDSPFKTDFFLKRFAIKDIDIKRSNARMEELQDNNKKDRLSATFLSNILLSEDKDVVKKYKMLAEKSVFNFNEKLMNENILADNYSLVNKLCSNRLFDKKDIENILQSTDSEDIKAKEEIYNFLGPKTQDFELWNIPNLISLTNKKNISFIKDILKDDEMFNHLTEFVKIICMMKDYNEDFTKNLLKDKIIPISEIKDIIDVDICFDKESFVKRQKIYELIKNDKDLSAKDKSYILSYTYDVNANIVEKLYTDKNLGFPKDKIKDIIPNITEINSQFCEKLCSDNNLGFSHDEIVNIINSTNGINIKFAEKICAESGFPKDKISEILMSICHENLKLAEKLCFDKELNFPKDEIKKILDATGFNNCTLCEELCTDKEQDFPIRYISKIMVFTNNENSTLIRKLCTDKELDFPKEEIRCIAQETNKKNLDVADVLCSCKNPKISVDKIIDILHKTKNSQLIIGEIIPKECIESTILSFEDQKQKIMNNPKLYVNGEDYDDEDDMRQSVSEFISDNYGSLLCLQYVLGKEGLNTMFRMRLKEVKKYIQTIEHFTPNQMKLVYGLVNSCNIYDKPFMPYQKIEFIDLMDGYRNNDINTDKIETMISEGKIDVSQLKFDLFNKIMKNLNFTDEEIAAIPKEKLLSWDTKYAHMLSKQIKSDESDALRDLIRAANLDDMDRYLHDTTNIYGSVNAETRYDFKDFGIDYDKWIHPSKTHEIKIVSKDKNREQLLKLADSIAERMNSFTPQPVKEYIKKQLPKFIENGKFFIPEEIATSRSKLEDLVRIIIDDSDTGQLSAIRKRAKSNVCTNDFQKYSVAKHSLEIFDDLNNIYEELKSMKMNKIGIKNSDNINWTVKMWDRNPQHDIFQGNYSNCCIGMGAMNGRSMPHYILNTAYNMIELVDNDTGTTVGNALCYFVSGKEKKPIFVIDNIEIDEKSKPSNNTGILVRDAIRDYSSSMLKEVTGNDNTPIYLGTSFNKVPITDLEPDNEQVSFIGEIVPYSIYMDLFEGWATRNVDFTREVEIVKLKDNL